MANGQQPTYEIVSYMEIYKLRFSFDPRSGICLWSENELARDRFGYPVELDSLEIAPSVKKMAEELIERFDTSLDWSDPAGLHYGRVWNVNIFGLMLPPCSDRFRNA